MTEAERECVNAYKTFEKVRNFEKEIPNSIYEYDIVLPDPPEDPTTIDNYGLPAEQRVFPLHPWDYVKEIDAMGADFPEKKQYLDTMWERRANGYWWYNGYKLEWIPGHYYMTLQYWFIPVQNKETRNKPERPKFIDMQRDISLALWRDMEDEKCAGLCFIGGRRSGKTALGLSKGYWTITEKYGAFFPIQSKTFTDAKKMLKKLVKSWQKLPDFLKPVDTGLSTAATKLEFSEPQERNTKGKRKAYGEVLDSWIEVFSSDPHAVDGDETAFQLQDEFGKRKDSDAALTQRVTKISNFVGPVVGGFSFWITTVEEMEKQGGAAAQEIWDESGKDTTDGNGFTNSTMHRLFFPAEYGQIEGDFIDHWGYSKLDEAAKWIENMMATKVGESLVDLRRKYPRKIEHAFMAASSDNTYNQHNLYVQAQFNAQLVGSAVPVRGNFYWVGGIKDTEVDFKPDPNGRWLVAWMPPKDDRNKFYTKFGQRYPGRELCYTGCDAFSHRNTVDKGSMGAGATILKRHPREADMRMSFVCLYLYRQTHPHQFHEDMILQCVFYSSYFLCEKNTYGPLDYFNKRGYDGFCLFNPLDKDSQAKWAKGERGLPTTGTGVREAMMDVTQAYINDYIGKDDEGRFGFCPFEELISDWVKFEPDNWTPYDAAVAAGMALIASSKVVQNPLKKYTIEDWLPQYSNTGNAGRRIA